MSGTKRHRGAGGAQQRAVVGGPERHDPESERGRHDSAGEAEQNAARGLLELDRLVHEPARLAILTVLAEAERVEFRFLENVTGLTRGNISSHTSKLEAAGYLTVAKEFRGRTPVTSYSITSAGREALETYRSQLRAFMRLQPAE